MTQQQFGFGLGTTRIMTAVSLNYVPQWGIKEVLREILQEMIDVRKKYGCSGSIHWRSGKAIIEDDGPGLKRQDLALGQSGKRGEAGLIGQFGEGLKLAALVTARMGRKMAIETVGFTAEPVVVWDQNLECNVLALDIRENTRAKGTRVTVEASRRELEEAKDLFLEFNKSLKEIAPGIYTPGGKVFINGALATVLPKALFSYSLSGEVKSAQNRDRTSLDIWELKAAVQGLFKRAASAKVAEIYFRYWKEQPDDLPWEYDFRIDPPKKVWAKTFRKIFGQKVCLAVPGAPEATLEAQRLGFKTLDGVPYYWESLLDNLGVLTTKAVITQKVAKPRRLVALRELAPEERANLAFARRIVKKYLGALPPIKIALELPLNSTAADDDTSVVVGLWDSGHRKVWLRRDALLDRAKVLGVLLHEVLHAKSGAPDATRAFEDAWQELAVAMVFKRPWQKP